MFHIVVIKEGHTFSFLSKKLIENVYCTYNCYPINARDVYYIITSFEALQIVYENVNKVFINI